MNEMIIKNIYIYLYWNISRKNLIIKHLNYKIKQRYHKRELILISRSGNEIEEIFFIFPVRGDTL